VALARPASDYLGPSWYTPKSRFNVADALSLGTLLGGIVAEERPSEKQLDFHSAAYASVTSELGLSGPGRLRETHARPLSLEDVVGAPASRACTKSLAG
jgi:hypothetical protein